MMLLRIIEPGLPPQLTGDFYGVDAGRLPPGLLIAGAMDRAMMRAAERDGVFVAALPPKAAPAVAKTMDRIVCGRRGSTDGTTDITATPGWKSGIGGPSGTGSRYGACRAPPPVAAQAVYPGVSGVSGGATSDERKNQLFCDPCDTPPLNKK